MSKAYSTLNAPNKQAIARVARTLGILGIAIAPATVQASSEQNTTDAAARRRLTYDGTRIHDTIVCRCGWPADAPVHHGIPRDEAHRFEAHAFAAHGLEDVRFVPQRHGHEPLFATNPIRGFAPDEIERFRRGETVVPIVPLHGPRPAEPQSRRDQLS